jgi:hypothetical protein
MTLQNPQYYSAIVPEQEEGSGITVAFSPGWAGTMDFCPRDTGQPGTIDYIDEPNRILVAHTFDGDWVELMKVNPQDGVTLLDTDTALSMIQAAQDAFDNAQQASILPSQENNIISVNNGNDTPVDVPAVPMTADGQTQALYMAANLSDRWANLPSNQGTDGAAVGAGTYDPAGVIDKKELRPLKILICPSCHNAFAFPIQGAHVYFKTLTTNCPHGHKLIVTVNNKGTKVSLDKGNDKVFPEFHRPEDVK